MTASGSAEFQDASLGASGPRARGVAAPVVGMSGSESKMSSSASSTVAFPGLGADIVNEVEIQRKMRDDL